MAASLLDNLNPEQQKAVTHPDGPVLVLAGAGSGKTRVIAHRIAYLLSERHVSPHSILAVTFTNKAASEMKERVLRLLQKDSLPFLWMGTFHSICARVLRADVEALDGPYTRDFTIYDADDTRALMRHIIREKLLTNDKLSPGTVLGIISRAKREGYDADAFAEQARSRNEMQVVDLFREYERRLHTANAMDFDDLLGITLDLLESRKDVLERYQKRFEHVLVDEYQDTNRIQYRFLHLLSSKWKDLFAVGDEDQSIYRWRGSDIQNILDFQKDFPKASVIRLERNYRSTNAILSAANAVIAHNTQRLGKELWTERAGGEKIRLFTAPSDREEAAYVADMLQSLRKQYDLKQMAVLYRTNAQSRALEEAFLNRGIPYQVVGGLKFYERREVKDILAYLRVGLNPMDRLSLLRILNIPSRGIGKTTQEKLLDLARERGTTVSNALTLAGGEEDHFSSRQRIAIKAFSALLDQLRSRIETQPGSEITEWLIAATGYVEYLHNQGDGAGDPMTRVENLQELVSALRQFEVAEQGDLRAFLERQALSSDQDDLDDGAGAESIKLLTLHAAKGLEFPVVVLAGLEYGLCPHILSMDSDAEVEEERRLVYVGMTRAMDRLFLTWSRERYIYGVSQQRTASPFLGEIPADMIEEVGGVSGEKAPASFQDMAAALDDIQYIPAEAGYRVGSRVHHKKYGLGIVLSTEGVGEDTKVTVSFSRFGRKKLLARLARLEVV